MKNLKLLFLGPFCSFYKCYVSSTFSNSAEAGMNAFIRLDYFKANFTIIKTCFDKLTFFDQKFFKKILKFFAILSLYLYNSKLVASVMHASK